MDRLQVRFALLKISLCAVLGSSWVFWSFIFATRPEVSQTDALSTLVRLPASLPAQMAEEIPGVFGPQVKLQEPIRMDMVKVSCWDRKEGPAVTVGARWVRITGRPCQFETTPDTVTIRNLANGYVATVFATQTKSLTTDFIPLESGPNELLVRFDQGQGTSVENRITLQR